jgi:hypothetical protein
MEQPMRALLRIIAFVLAFSGLGLTIASAQNPPPPSPPPSQFSPVELVNAGHQFFGTVSRGLASVVERAVSNWGQPNGYILGQEGGGAFVAGLRSRKQTGPSPNV